MNKDCKWPFAKNYNSLTCFSKRLKHNYCPIEFIGTIRVRRKIMGENFQDQDLSSLLGNSERHYAEKYPAVQCKQPVVGGNW